MFYEIIVFVLISVLIYRLGLVDGTRLKQGEKIDMGIKVKKRKSYVEEETREKLTNGIKNILNYGLEEKKNG